MPLKYKRFRVRLAEISEKAGPSACWIWPGKPNSSGYGFTTLDGVQDAVHRHAYRLLRGPIPSNAELDHLCRTKLCMNPGHTELVTHRVNVLRGDTVARAAAERTECDEGHPLIALPANRSRALRGCLICRRKRSYLSNRKTREKKRRLGLSANTPLRKASAV